jgi:hypothetical protein
MRVDPLRVKNFNFGAAFKHFKNACNAQGLSFQPGPVQRDFISFYGDGLFSVGISIAHIRRG